MQPEGILFFIWNAIRRHDPSFLTTWLEKHAEDAQTRLGKPLVLEEVGLKLSGDATAADIASKRDPIFSGCYDAVEESISAGGALVGSAFWHWDLRVWGEATITSGYQIGLKDSTFGLIEKHARWLQAQAAAEDSREGSCGRCWTPQMHLLGTMRRCVMGMEACGRNTVGWKSKEECCEPGQGFEKGCSGFASREG
jgi:hypothetical protein